MPPLKTSADISLTNSTLIVAGAVYIQANSKFLLELGSTIIIEGYPIQSIYAVE